MAEPQTATCPQCSRLISPEDTIVFGRGRLGHLDCRRPRVLSAEERTLVVLYCQDHEVAECFTCARRLRPCDLVSREQFGSGLHVCQWCRADLTDSVRAHLYGCAMLPAEVRHRAQVARDAARNLVKRSLELRDAADVAAREAEAAIHSLRETMRKAPTHSATSGTKHPVDQVRLLSYHVLPRHLQVGDRFSDETGEWEIASRPYLTAGGQSIQARVRRVDQPATGEDVVCSRTHPREGTLSGKSQRLTDLGPGRKGDVNDNVHLAPLGPYQLRPAFNAQERDRHPLGTHAVACDAGGGRGRR
jgi:hypothetical protein